MQKAPEPEASGTNVQVAVRCRPVNAQEREIGCPMCISTETVERKVNVACGTAGKKTTKTFNFDRVFGMYSTQEEVFSQMVMPLVQETLQGFNCTVFAYGQTGTGKTHTMEGDIHSEEHAGIVPRSVKAILEQLEQSGVEFTIRVSFLELYNEELQDLLMPPNSDKKLKLCEVEKKGVVCQNLEEITVLSVKDIFEILQRGILQRQTAATLCNKNSSRSHSIFTMKIMIKESNVDGEEVVRHGQLNLVDLAGSECVGRSGAKNDRAREAGSINQSLLTLGRVITALVDHHGHIPYRDSKLTRLLQESLGGKAKTCIIATLSPSQNAVEESLSTLDYAHRAKNIKNMPQVNQRMTKKTVMKEYCEEIESLRAQLQANRDKNGVYVLPDVYYGMEAKIASQDAQIAEVESILRSKMEETKAAKAEKDAIEERFNAVEAELSSTTSQLLSTKEKLQTVEIECKETAAQLGASQAVIYEQEITEGELMSTGMELQGEVSVQRADRAELFGKIFRLKTHDGQRLTQTQTFIEDLLAKTSHLSNGVAGMLAGNDAEAEKMCSGVNEMLARGRVTCSSVADYIGQAVQALIHKSESNTQVSSSLNDIKYQLDNSNTELAKSLQGMQHLLSAWLGEVDSTMQASLLVLNQQSQTVVAMQQAIQLNSTRMAETAALFMKEQAASSEKLAAATAALTRDVEAVLTEQQQTFENMAKTASVNFTEKTEKMQAAVNEMFKDIMSSNKENSAEMSKCVAANAHHTKCVLTEKNAAVQNINKESFAMSANAVSQLAEASASSNQSTVEHIHSVLTFREKVATNLCGISETVGAKRAFLNSTVDSVLADNEASIALASKTVGTTAMQVGALVSEIKVAAADMNSATSKSISEFTGFMDSQGQHVCMNVGAHFEKLTSYLGESSANIVAAQKQTAEFQMAMSENALPVTGATPTKVVLSNSQSLLQSLPSTRDHEAIKSEHRAGKWSMQSKDMQTEGAGAGAVETETAAEALRSIQAEDGDASEVCTPPESKQSGGKKRSDSPVTADDVENANPNKAPRSSSVASKTSAGVAPAVAAKNTGIARRTSTRPGVP